MMIEQASTRKQKAVRVRRAPQAPKVNVHVDRETINTAVVRNSSHCMIADAVKKALPYAKNVSVDLQSIRVTDAERGLRYIWLTPRTAQLALIAFDQGEKPQPFRIELLRGSVRRAGLRTTKKDWAVPLADRLRIVSALQDARSARKVSFAEIGDATDISANSLEHYVSASPPVFSRIVADKLEAWIARKPIPHRRPNVVSPSLVSGTARIRPLASGSERAMPEVIGGKSPPLGNIAKRRGFGLRSMVV